MGLNKQYPLWEGGMEGGRERQISQTGGAQMTIGHGIGGGSPEPNLSCLQHLKF